VIVVYRLLTLGVPPVAGFCGAVLATFVGTWAIYAGLVRPWRWIRPLFGMKALSRERLESLPRPTARLK
jgi:glucan biosynthesis protein C